MAKYQLIVQCRGAGTSEEERDYYKSFVEDTMKLLIDIASNHSLELLSVYLMKTTDSAPADLERKN